jgi:hypothetical protein
MLMLGTHSTYPKGGVSCSKDSLVGNQTLVFQIKFCDKNPALRVAAKRYHQPSDELNKINWEKMTNIIRLGFLNIWEFANSVKYLNLTPAIDFPVTPKR